MATKPTCHSIFFVSIVSLRLCYSICCNIMGKQRLYRCRFCGHEARDKVDSWQHIKIHIKPEKLLACNECQFVTEFKHHLEYHQRNHAGLKPYRCDKCDYQCVNKSMLNSHMKSHSSDYQYQCGDCKYATRYSHSLKMHLKKYDHQPNGLIRGDTPSVDCLDQQFALDLRVDTKLK